VTVICELSSESENTVAYRLQLKTKYKNVRRMKIVTNRKIVTLMLLTDVKKRCNDEIGVSVKIKTN
jgi:hypothetical protein